MSDNSTPVEESNRAIETPLTKLLGLGFETISDEEIVGVMEASEALLAPNGFLHAGTVVTLADICCGAGAMHNLPEGALHFTTIDLSSNFLSTTNSGKVICRARPLHLGRQTQVWDATVTSEKTGRVMAHFRCTQMVLWPRG